LYGPYIDVNMWDAGVVIWI